MRLAISPPLSAAFAILALAATAENFPLGTYVYRGSVMNYKHEVCSSADGADGPGRRDERERTRLMPGDRSRRQERRQLRP